nr:hypothetical protein [Tanacetum cinerariifolium]
MNMGQDRQMQMIGARPRRRDAAYLQTQLLIAQKEEAGIQLQAEEYDLMAAAADLDEIEEIAQPGMNMGPDRQMQMIGGNGGNQFRQYAGQNAGNLNGYNEVQNVGNQVAQNPRIQNIGNQNGLIGVQWNGIQNQIGNGNLVAIRAEGNAAGQNANQIRCYNCRGIGHYARNYTARPKRRDAAYL